MRTVLLFACTGLLVSSCAEFAPTDVSGFDCQDVENFVVDLSDGAMIKIMNDQETSRTEDELVCHGTGIYSDNSQVRTRYKVWIDAEGGLMYSYDVDEAIAQEWRQIEAEAEREAARAVREFEDQMRNLGY